MPNLDLANSRVLVTGGAGFIGSALVWEPNRRGCDDIIICDLLEESEKWKNLVALRYSDYIEADDLIDALEDGTYGGFDLILHMGACSATTELDASYLVHNNYEFTRELAEWALERGTRFVYASSAATYGDGAQGMSDSAQLNTLRPLNMYGYSKHMFDLYAERQGYANDIVGLKFFNVYGPNEGHKGDMRSVVNKAFTEVTDTGKISLFKSYHPDYNDGEQQRDFLYVKDCINMTLHLATNPEAGGLYNLGSGEARTWVDLANALFAALGKEPNIEFIEMPQSLQPKYQYFTQADIAKLRAAGYDAPLTPLNDAVADYVTNYMAKGTFLGDE